MWGMIQQLWMLLQSLWTMRFKLVLYLAYGSQEKTNTGWKFLNKYIKQKRKKQDDKAKNQTVQIGSVRLSSEGVNRDVCVKPEFVDGHVCYKLRNSLGGYGGGKGIRWSW